MASELSFLIDLLMNHKLSKATKELIAERIKEVESRISYPMNQGGVIRQPMSNPTVQSASTLALMAKHNGVPHETPIAAHADEIIPVEQIAQTPAAQAAMAHRQQALLDPQKRLADPATGRPRKW